MNKILKVLAIILFITFADYGFKYPIFHWIIFYFYANVVIYLTIKTYIYSKKLTKIDIANLILILVFLLYLIIYGTRGWLIYPCIFTILSMIAVVIIVIVRQKIQDKKRVEIIQSKPKQAKSKEPKSKIQPKKTLNFKNVKLNHKNKFDKRN
ncbi:hypothetical protein [Campylobacter majalis]|uniref:hypothetical protein n=1 Tax=Campylobacter majalis TaxID=2790656 RepID=UPI003D68AAC9